MSDSNTQTIQSSLKEKAKEAFEKIKFPQKTNEEWRFCDTQKLLEKKWTKAQLEKTEEKEEKNKIKLINGKVFIPKKLEKGISAQITTTDETGFIGHDKNSFSYLNTLEFEDCLKLTINSGNFIEEPLYIEVLSHSEAVSFPRIHIHIETESSLTLGINWVGEEKSHLINASIKITLEKHAELRLTSNQVTEKAIRILNQQIIQEEGSILEYIMLFKEGEWIRQDTIVTLHGKGTHCDLKGLALLSGKNEFYNHLEITHLSEENTARQHFKNILTEQSKSEFSGLVTVNKHCHKVSSEQLNQNLLLSDTARAISRPKLIIDADDVECAHGCTVGQLNPEEVFYIQSRGLKESEAKTLLTYGFAEEIIEEIPIESIKDQLEEILKSEILNYVK